MASKVLGQYDLAPGGTPGACCWSPRTSSRPSGELEVDPADFRRWVCMHEETHRVQFTAEPVAARPHGRAPGSLAVDLAPDPERLHETAGRRRREAARGCSGEGSTRLADLFTTPEQREQARRAHRGHVAARGPRRRRRWTTSGPRVIPTVAHIRARFSERRKGAGTPDRLLRRLLGLEAKMRQYRDGAVFVRGVQDKVGVEGFNAVWSSPDTLPLAREIEEPEAWVRRVHG